MIGDCLHRQSGIAVIIVQLLDLFTRLINSSVRSRINTKGLSDTVNTFKNRLYKFSSNQEYCTTTKQIAMASKTVSL